MSFVRPAEECITGGNRSSRVKVVLYITESLVDLLSISGSSDNPPGILESL